MTEELPKKEKLLSEIEKEMKSLGFHSYRVDSTHSTTFSKETKMFEINQDKTFNEMVSEYKNLPEFADFKDKFEIKPIEYKKDCYYIFVKIN